MKPRITLFYLVMFLISCIGNKQEKLNGYWVLSNEENEEAPLFPRFIKFSNGELIISNDFYFQLKGMYQLKADSVFLKFNDGSFYKMHLQFEDDDILLIDGKDYYHVDSNFYHLPAFYELINYPSSRRYDSEGRETIIHLIKVDEETKVITNDAVHDLKSIPSFVSYDHGNSPAISVFVGEKIRMSDLVTLYSYIVQGSPNSKINLIVRNEGFDKLFSIKDKILFCDSSHCGKMFPISPMCYIYEFDSLPKIELQSENDFLKIQEFSKDRSFIIYPNETIDITTYFRLKELLLQFPKSKIIFKRLTTPC